MDDVREVLETIVRQVDVPDRGPRSVRHAVTRRKLRSRVLAGVTALAVMVLALVWLLEAFGGSVARAPASQASPQGPLDVASLERAWSADLPTGNGVTAPVEDADRIYLMDVDGVA